MKFSDLNHFSDIMSEIASYKGVLTKIGNNKTKRGVTMQNVVLKEFNTMKEFMFTSYEAIHQNV